MVVNPSPQIGNSQNAQTPGQSIKKTVDASAGTTAAFSNHLNAALQASTAQTSTTANNQAATLADLFSILLQGQLNNLLASSLGASGLDGSGSSQDSGNLLASNLLPILLGDMANNGGEAGLPSLSNQIPLGSLSIPPVSMDPSTAVTGVPAAASGTVGQSTIEHWIDQLAPRYGLSPKLVKAVVTEESGFSPTATSSAGAIGLMQLMPETAKVLGVSNPYDPLSNLQGGMLYLSRLVNEYHGNLAYALAAYNAGSGAVNTYGGIPPYPETERYVQNILALMNQ